VNFKLDHIPTSLYYIFDFRSNPQVLLGVKKTFMHYYLY
jgi:hypothetical protein